MVSALLALLLLTHTSSVTASPKTGFGTAHGALVDHQGKPIFDADIRVWTRFPPTTYRPEETWRVAKDVHPYGRSGFEVASVWAGQCTLVARYGSPSAQNFIVRDFVLADGDSADLGELGPTGNEHGFRLAVLPETTVKQAEQETPIAPEIRDGVVNFEMSSRDPVVDAFMHCKFSMPCGAVVTVRGLDALAGPFEVEAQVREERLLGDQYRAVTELWPRAALGGQTDNIAHLELVVARARAVDLEFVMPVELRLRDVESLECAVVDRAGNVRQVVEYFEGKRTPRKRVLLAPGKYVLYAVATTWNSRWDDTSGAIAYQEMSVPDAGADPSIQICLKRGVTVTGKLTGRSKGADAAFTSLVRGESGGKADGSHFLPFRIRPRDGEFTLHNLPPGVEISFGHWGMKPEDWKTVLVPNEGGSIGDILLD